MFDRVNLVIMAEPAIIFTVATCFTANVIIGQVVETEAAVMNFVTLGRIIAVDYSQWGL